MAGETMTEPNGWPIRIAVRVDFSDGAQHEYDVRGEDAVAIHLGAAFWPEGVVTADVAKRMEHDRKRQEEVAALKAERDQAVRLLDDALFLRMNGERPPGAPLDPRAETWRDWEHRAELFLRSRQPAGERMPS